MRKLPKAGLVALVAGIVTVGMVVHAGLNVAEARPAYKKDFVEKYPDVKPADCTLCHPGKEKKERNNYGKAIEQVLEGKKNVKKDFGTYLEKAEKLPSAIKGKTFGELIKTGNLPAATE